MAKAPIAHRPPASTTQCRVSGTLLMWGLIGGCSLTEGSTPAADILNNVSNAATGTTITTTFSEGTNMSAARNPISGDYVLSLQGTLFTLPADGGTARAITDYFQDAREPQIAPDGKNVVYHGYAGGNWDLFLLNLESHRIRALTADEFDDREPTWSPDGQSIAFSSDRSGNYDLWLLTVADGAYRQITKAPEDDYSPSFSADGKTLYFARQLQRSESELRFRAIDGGASGSLIREAGTINGVSVSPEHPWVAYQLLRRDRVGHAHTELKVHATHDQLNDGKGKKQATAARVLSKPGDDVFPFRATWKQNELGMAVNGKLQNYPLNALTVSTQRTPDLKVSKPTIIPFSASVTLKRPAWERKRRDYSSVSKPTLGIVAPALSHDGGRVAFTALGDLWQWNLVSDELVQLTDDRYAEASPVYSPNGKYIAYVSDRAGSAQLWLHSLTDGVQRLLDKNITGVSYPSWSPNGEHLAYFGSLRDNPMGGQLMLANLTTGNSRSIGLPIAPQPLSWSKDSQHLAVAALDPYSRRYREGVYQLRVFNTAGKQIRRISLSPHRSPLDVRLTPDGKGVGYVQGGQLLYQPIDEKFNTTDSPRRLGNALADMPAWSGNGREVLTLSGNTLNRYNVASGALIATHSVPLDYTRDLHAGSWTLRAGRMFDGNTPTYQRNIDIVITDNRIERITPHSDANPEPIVDVTDYAVIPGLFEMHAHMGLLSEPQGRTWLSWGITSVRDPGSNPYLAKERQETWDSGRRVGPRTHITGYLTDGTRVFYPIAEGLDDTTLQNAMTRTRALQLDFIKTYVRLPDHQQKRVIDFAHAEGIPVSSHELFPAAAIGSDHVEHIGGTSRRGYQPKVSSLGYSYNDVVELLASSGMGITPTVVLPAWAVIFAEDKDLFATPQFQHFYGPAALNRYGAMASRFGDGAKSQHRANAELLKKLVQRDALLVTGTDSPFVPYGPGLHAELRLYERAGLEPWQVLRAATASSAEAAGVGTELGQIAAGMLADLVVLKGDPLATIKDADNVVLTVKGGRRFEIAELLQP